MKTKDEMSWASEEFADVDLGDKRLNTRLMRICDSFAESPESPINQACADWAESKAAYRFFQNDKVEEDEIMAAHCQKTGSHPHDLLPVEEKESYRWLGLGDSV